MIAEVRTRKARTYFKVTKYYLNQMLSRYGKKLTCFHCGKEIEEGEWILSKPTGGSKKGNKKAKRYCEDCRKKLNIWLPMKNTVTVKR